jgi:hypothetical protein
MADYVSNPEDDDPQDTILLSDREAWASVAGHPLLLSAAGRKFELRIWTFSEWASLPKTNQHKRPFLVPGLGWAVVRAIDSSGASKDATESD